jgi:hypothetical protein
VTQSEQVKTNFKRRLTKAVDCHSDLMLAVHKKLNQAALETMLVEQFAMLSVVQWESFLNEIIIAYAVMRPGAAMKSLKARIEKSIEVKFGGRAAKCINFKVKKPITWERIVGLLDPNDWNITVTSAEKLSSKANEILAAEFAKRFSLDKADSQFIDFAVALRNYLSHRSTGARAELKRTLKGLSEPKNAIFNARLVDPGTYLKTKYVTGKTRAGAFAERLIEVSEKL